MQNFDDLDIEGRNPSHLSEEEREKEDYDRKRLMRSSVKAEDGTLRPVYSIMEDDDIWCHICNISLFGSHKLMSHNIGNRHKMKLDELPYSVSLWSNRVDGISIGTKNSDPSREDGTMTDNLAPGEPVPPGMEDQITRLTTIQMSLDRHRSSPLVGLEYLIELIDNDSCEPSYTCVLCDKRGDPRTVMAHITSFNHRITYLNRHFPTVARAIAELPRPPNYKRGANEISVIVAKKIEERFGRLQPQLVEKQQFEKNKIQYIKRVFQDYHFRETADLTFMEVYDVRWVTHFEEKMAEVEAAKKKDTPVGRYNKFPNHHERKDNPGVTIEELPKKEDKKLDKDRSVKKIESKEKEKPVMKIRILTKEKLNASRKPEKSDKKRNPDSAPLRPSDDTKSLSSLSSISSSPSPTRSRSNSRSRAIDRASPTADRSPTDRTLRRDRQGSARSRRSRSRSSSRYEPLRERDKWSKYREQIKRVEEILNRSLKFHEKNPEKHPAYPDEWKKFWNRRYKELQSEGKDPSKHDFKPEWIKFWTKRMREIHNEELQRKKEDTRKRLDLPEDRPPERYDGKNSERGEKWIPLTSSSRVTRERSPSPKRSRHRTESDDDVEYVGTTTAKPEYHRERREDSRDRDYGYTYTRGRTGIYRTATYYPPGRVIAPPPGRRHYPSTYGPPEDSPKSVEEEKLPEDLEIVGLLRLLTALEGQLGSLGPKVVTLLSKALAAEKVQPNSAEELLQDEEVNVLFETVKEKLKGQLFAGMIEKVAIAATKSAIQNIAQLLHKAAEDKKKMLILAAQIEQEELERRKKREIELSRPLTGINASRAIYERAMQITSQKSEPVSVPGVGCVDKIAIAQQIAAALVTQGRTNVSQAELETLINAVVGMAEASKGSEKPITAANFVQGLTVAAQSAPSATVAVAPTANPVEATVAPPVIPPIVVEAPKIVEKEIKVDETFEVAIAETQKSSKMEMLSDNDLKTLLQSFKELGTDEQHGLINFLKKLEATDPARVERLRGFVNLGNNSGTTKRSASPKDSQSTRTQVTTSKSCRSTSPFSSRKGNQNPTDDDAKWKPKLDMFADDEEMSNKRNSSNQDGKKMKTKIVLSDDDDDYTFEDIYKAADKNVNENEKARRKKSSRENSNDRSWSRSRSRSRSRSASRSRLRSRTRSRSRSLSRRSASARSRDGGGSDASDPNAILNETKRLIANIMGDLPNKYVVKSHQPAAIAKSTVNEQAERQMAAIPQLPVPQQNLYGPSYSAQQSLQQQPGPMNYQPMGNQYTQNYPQQNFNNSAGYINNGYNYNQGYGNAGNMMTNNQGQYGGSQVPPTNQYPQTPQAPPQQQSYGMPQQYGGAGGAPVGYPQQQYGNYSQQRFY